MIQVSILCVNGDIIRMASVEDDRAMLLKFLQQHDHEGSQISVELTIEVAEPYSFLSAPECSNCLGDGFQYDPTQREYTASCGVCHGTGVDPS